MVPLHPVTMPAQDFIRARCFNFHGGHACVGRHTHLGSSVAGTMCNTCLDLEQQKVSLFTMCFTIEDASRRCCNCRWACGGTCSLTSYFYYTQFVYYRQLVCFQETGSEEKVCAHQPHVSLRQYWFRCGTFKIVFRARSPPRFELTNSSSPTQATRVRVHT